MKHLLKNLFFFFFLVSNFSLIAQNNKVKDSLEKIIATAKEDSIKLKAYRQLEFQCQDRKEYIAVNKRELALAEKVKDYYVVANMKANLAYFEYTDGHLAESEKLYLDALSIGKEKKFDVIIGGVYNGLMMLSWKQANIDKVMKYYKLGEDFLSQAKSYKFLTRLYFSASDIFRDLKIYDKALSVARLSVNASLLSKDSANISGAYSILGNQLVFNKKPDSALLMLDKSLLYLSQNHNYVHDADVFHFRATALKELKRYPEAIESTLKALEISKKYQYVENYDREHELLINLYFSSKNFAKAKEILAIREANVNEDSINLKRFSYQTRANIALVENDIDKWNYYSEKYDSVENLFTSNTIKKSIVEFETKYNVAKKEAEIARQETESKKRFWIIVALTLGLVSIGIAAMAQYVIYKNKQKLAKQQQQIALAEERVRIAADMHDDMGAGISRIRFLGEGIKHMLLSEKGKEDVNTMIGLSDDLVDKMNQIIWTLNTGDEPLQEIFYYIRSQCSQLVNDAGIEFESNIPDDLPNIIYTAAQKRNIYLAIKEAVHNALKHAHATEIKMNVAINKNIIVTIADNGKGFDLATAKGNGNGLFNYEKRVKAFGGSFEINSNTSGTMIQFKIPLK